MTLSHADLTATIRQVITDTAASSPNYDSDTLADVIATAIDPTPAPSNPTPDPHEIADGKGTIVYPDADPAETVPPEPAAGHETPETV